MPKNFLKDVEAAEYINVKTQTLRNWRSKGQGPPYVKLGRSVRYEVADLLNYTTQRKIVPEA